MGALARIGNRRPLTDRRTLVLDRANPADRSGSSPWRHGRHPVISAAFGSAGNPAEVGRVSAESVIFEPLQLPNLTVKNRILRSSVAGRFDNYDGSGTEARINWDVKFARGGVGAIISSNAPIHERGHIVPGYAYLDADDKIPFWRELGKRVHEHDCKYVVQLVFAGRERILPGLRYDVGTGRDRRPGADQRVRLPVADRRRDRGRRRRSSRPLRGGCARRASTASSLRARTGCCSRSS